MRLHRVLVLAMALSMSIFMLAPPASAWEINLDGSYTWEFDMRGQMGTNGFFGPYYTDNSTAATLHSANAWLGAQNAPGDQLVSGTNGSDNIMYMNTNVDLRINPALRVRGTYYIGSWNNPDVSVLNTASATYVPGPPISVTTATTSTAVGVDQLNAFGAPVASQYFNYTAPGVQRSFSPGYWNTLWLTAQLPWGTLAIGKRPSLFGTGLSWNGAENRSSEQFTISAPYGPLNILVGFYPSREEDKTSYYNRNFDQAMKRLYDSSWTVVYRDGPLDMGILMNWVRMHRNPERLVANNATKINSDTRERDDFYGGVYFKYNNGRFFMNSEFDWYDRMDRIYQRTIVNGVTGNTNRAATRAFINYRLMSELGVLAGPSKVSLMASWLSGDDRRRGVTDNITQGQLTDAILGTGNRFQSSSTSNTGLYRPYSYLMVYAYGLGTHINADTGNGYVEDAMTYSARVDYAVAANLNVYSSFFWADRVGNGYGWGFLKPDANAFVTGSYKGSAGQTAVVTNAAPNIPDNNLGWEIDAGFDWKLLEGLLVNATFAYWQPGKWFNFACVDKNISNWNTAVGGFGTNPAAWGIWPDRHIDAIWGSEIKVVAEF